MPPKVKKGGASKKKASLYKKPPPIPPGEILRDTNGRTWIIGPSIGVGGFGEIYSACEYLEGTYDKSNYPYVVKIEPIENGPLFVECNFYKRQCNEDDIADFMDSKGLSQLGMPVFLGTGEHWLQEGNKKTHLRFLILERYGTDINKKFKECGRFPAPTVFLLGLQVLDVLEYVHSRSFIHADIKGANILLGIQPGTEHQAYLLDFGLAWRVVGHNYMPNSKCAHEGTLDYTSTDRHIGAQTMRGDLEILAYNMLQWLTGSLPWEGIEDPNTVHKMKAQLMENVRDRVQKDYPHVPDHLFKFFEYIKTLDMPDVPNHESCQRIFESYLTSVGKTRQSKLEFPLLARNEITNINVATSDLTKNLTKSKTGTTSAVSQEIGDKNQRKPIKRRLCKKPSMNLEDSNKLDVNKIKPIKTKIIKRRTPKKPSMDSEDSDKLELNKIKPKYIKRRSPTHSTESKDSEIKLTKETAVRKATDELGEDLIYALKLHEELNKEPLGDSNNQRPRRNTKAPDRFGFSNTPAEITTKPRNFKKKRRSLIPSDKAKYNDTHKNNNKTTELYNEKIEDKETNKSVETNKMKELICPETDVSIIDLDSTNELSTENVIENKELTSPEGKKTKVNLLKEPLAVAPLQLVYEVEDTSDQEKSYPKCMKIKKSTSLKIPKAIQKYLENMKVNEVEVDSESENDDLDGLPEVSFTSSHSGNSSSIRSLRDDSVASSSGLKNKIKNKHMDEIEQEMEENHDIEVLRINDSISKKRKFSDPKGEPTTKREHSKTIYDEHAIESSTETVSAQPVHVDDKNITKTKGSQAKWHKTPEILSSVQNSEDDKLLGNHHEREVLNISAEVQISSGDIIKHSVIKNQEAQQVSEKCKNYKDRVAETISQTEANNKMNQKDDNSEPKSNKKKLKNKNKNASSETSSNTVKSVDAVVCRAKQRNRHSEPDISSTIKNSENDTLVGVNTERPVLNNESYKVNNESYKLNNTSELISSTDDIIENSVIEDQSRERRNRKHKKLTDKMAVTETDNKSDREKVDGELKSKKKKINKSIYICTSEIGDTDVSRPTKSSDFSSDVKQSECNDFQTKPEKNKKKYKSSDAYTSKSIDANTILSPVSMDDAKDNREKEDGEPQGKKKKKDKSSYSSAYDGINASHSHSMTRTNSSNVGKESKTTAKKVSEHTKQLELTDVPEIETTNDITKIKKKKTKAREDSGSDGDFDSKYKSIPANKNIK